MNEPVTGSRCPICGKPTERQFRPFCSARCRDLDLGKWLDGRYAIPAVESDDSPDESGEEPER